MYIKIANKKIGEGNPVYTVAEIGLNHQGNIAIAKKLIDLAIEAGFDAVKFQKRKLDKIYKKNVNKQRN
jgi:sialic acid synthase SpsE